ncbi:hypothetical protein Tco_1031616 [Tanacetum coccineum]|uniref:Uncharacterized protein n=1 Tax=Tanacetum coccineum TaxID=301880 RepID=A0ABQ5GAZ7_9ASTR
MWIFLSELVFTFPSELRTSLGVPSNLDYWNAASLQPFNFTEGHPKCFQAKGSRVEESRFIEDGGEIKVWIKRRGCISSLRMFICGWSFDGAFGGVEDEKEVVGEGVVVTSSSLEMLTNNCLGGIMVSLIFLEGLDEEALVEFMVE